MSKPKKAWGLCLRNGRWSIDTSINGKRIREAIQFREHELEEALRFRDKRLTEIRNALYYGIRPKYTFNEAVIKYLRENGHKCSIKSEVGQLRYVCKFIGHLPLSEINMPRLEEYINSRKHLKARTINYGLQVIRQILNLAANSWIDENGLTWLERPAKIKLLNQSDAREPEPLSWEQQNILFPFLPPHLRLMAEFAINTGCRDGEICRLRWEWEKFYIYEDSAGNKTIFSIFIIPHHVFKMKRRAIVVLNDEAKKIVDNCRNNGSEFVFTYKNKPIKRMLNSAWKKAREKAGLNVRVHDLRHTFGRRLRSAGIPFETRQDLMRHKNGNITTHYSEPELWDLRVAANSIIPQTKTVTNLSHYEYHKTKDMQLTH